MPAVPPPLRENRAAADDGQEMLAHYAISTFCDRLLVQGEGDSSRVAEFHSLLRRDPTTLPVDRFRDFLADIATSCKIKRGN
jgi:hypothetical protein